MKKLDIFVLRSFIGPLVLTFFIVLFILILQFLWMYVDELAGKGLELNILAELLFQFSLTFVPMAFPLAILLASLMTFGNMGEFSELSALKSSGIPLQRIMSPIIFLVLIICGISFFFSNNVQPYSYRKARTLLYDIRRKRPELNIQAGTFNNDIDGFSIRVSEKDPNTNRMDKLLIYDHRDKKGNNYVIYADSGYMKVTPDETGMIMTLYNGFSYYEAPEDNVSVSYRKYPFRRDHFKEQVMVVSLSGFDLERTEIDLFRSNYATQNILQLDYYIDSLTKDSRMKREEYYTEFITTKIYNERNFTQPAEFMEDSTHIQSRPVFYLTEVFDSLPLVEKRSAVAKAIENAKFSSTYLDQKEGYLHYDTRNIRNYQVELHKKFTIAFACIVFFLIGAPLGAIIRKGGLGTPAVISILFFVAYYIISISAEKLVKENLVNTFAGMWSACAILLPIGIFLTYKATTDSSLLNTETYFLFLKKIKDRVYRLVFNIKNENPSVNQ